MENSQPQTGKGPAAKFRYGRIHASIWANETESGTRYSATFERRYKDRETGEWRSTQSFDNHDLAALGFLVHEVNMKILQLQSEAGEPAA